MPDTEAAFGGRPVPSEPAAQRARRLRLLRKNSAAICSGICAGTLSVYSLLFAVQQFVRVQGARR